MKIKNLYSKFLNSTSISTDTRNISKDSMFFALKGENFDANVFASEALKKGARYVVIDNVKYHKESSAYILVDDVLKTLQELAQYHRTTLGIPIIALTGSNGKTTTKELINSVLSQQYNTVATKGNLNNHIGVPLTLLSMNQDTEIAIVEMGANHFNEIATLCNIARPNYGYITNFGKAHLEGFGSIEGVIKAKSELYDFLQNNGGTIFINPEDSIQVKRSNKQKSILLDNLKLVEDAKFLKVKKDTIEIQSNLVGKYNFPNIAAAVGIGEFFKVDIKLIKKGIESYIPKNKRSEIIKKRNVKILLDAYNANPTSMEAALSNFHEIEGEHKIVILGDMFELGASVAKEHQHIADLAETYHFEKVILLGENFSKVRTKNAIKYNSYESFKKNFDKTDYENTYMLIKGSRGMALERIVSLFD